MTTSSVPATAPAITANLRAKPEPIIVVGVTLISVSGDNAHSDATIRTTIGGVSRTFVGSATNIGPVEAICRAFRPLVPDFTWKDYSVRALTAGEDAVAKSCVTLVQGTNTFVGEGTHTNTLHADAAAVAAALDKLRWHKWNEARKREPALAK